MNRWTEREDALLEFHAHEGAEGCSKALRAAGRKRTPSACIARAHRLGISLQPHDVCVGCGRRLPRIPASGLCPACAKRARMEAYRERTELMRSLAREEDETRKEVMGMQREEWRERKRRQAAKRNL